MSSEPHAQAQPALDRLVELVRSDPAAPVARSTIPRAREVHVADSLSGLEVPELTAAGAIADLGAGAGFPGLVLAAALPDARVDLVESASRKCEFLARAIERMGIGNARVLCERAELLAAGAGRESYDAVTARAVGPLATLAELASPLLRQGGVLVAWKGRRVADEEEAAARAGERTALEPLRVVAVRPYRGSRARHIHVLRKNGPTPNGLPRRPGMAAKRPFGSE